MKKALAILLCLALVGAGAFAGTSEYLSFSSWGRALWDVAGTEGDDIVTGMHQSWGGAAPRTSISAYGGTDNVSYALDVFGDGWDLGMGDNAYIDIHPFGGMDIPFQVSWLMGKDDMNEARRDTTYGLWGWDRIGSVNKESMEGFIFMDMLDVSVGTSLRMYFLDGLGVGRLTLAAALDFSGSGTTTEEDATITVGGYDMTADITTSTSEGGSELGWKSLANAWGNANYYLSYALPSNIGTISVGYDSRYSEDGYYDTWGIINAAFEFTMVDNLYIAVGAKISTSEDDGTSGNEWGTTGAPHQVNLYARYGFDGLGLPLNLHLLFGSKINTVDWCSDDPERRDGFGFQVGLGVDYEVIENVPIFLDFRYANGVYMNNMSAKNNDCITLGIGISKKWSNAELGVAFAMATNGYDPTSSHGTTVTYNNDGSRNADLTWAIPIKFEYSF